MTYRDVEPSAAWHALRDDPELCVLDVRTAEEHASYRIAGARLVPVQELPARLEELEPERHYLVVCEHGVRSIAACQILAQHGFDALQNLMGGMARWAGQGLPVERG